MATAFDETTMDLMSPYASRDPMADTIRFPALKRSDTMRIPAVTRNRGHLRVVTDRFPAIRRRFAWLSWLAKELKTLSGAFVCFWLVMQPAIWFGIGRAIRMHDASLVKLFIVFWVMLSITTLLFVLERHKKQAYEAFMVCLGLWCFLTLCVVVWTMLGLVIRVN